MRRQQELPGPIIGRLLSGELVVDRPTNSHRHDLTDALLTAALSRIDARGRGTLVEEIHFDQVVGETTRVTTGSDDRIVFARRPNRGGPTRWVLGRQPVSSRSVLLILRANRVGYVLVTGYIGTYSEPEPWDERAFSYDARGYEIARRAAVEDWAEHALILGSEPVLCCGCGERLEQLGVDNVVGSVVLCPTCSDNEGVMADVQSWCVR